MREIVFAIFGRNHRRQSARRTYPREPPGHSAKDPESPRPGGHETEFSGVTSTVVVADSYASTSAWFKYVLRQYRTMGHVVRTQLDLVCPDALIKYKVCSVSKLKGIMQNPNVPPRLTSLNAAHIIMH